MINDICGKENCLVLKSKYESLLLTGMVLP